MPREYKVIDLTGQRFGRLTVVKKIGIKNAGQRGSKSVWLCKCDCGNEKEVLRNSLVSGNTKSCGCLGVETKKLMHLKHGMAKKRLWKIWTGIRDRCNNPNNSSYHYYGGRGISVCDEWNDFEKFMIWSISNGYDDTLTIDRIDTNGNYEPSNCKWSTRMEQTRNRNITKKVTYGDKKIPVSEVAEIEGITYQKAYDKYVRRQ